MAMHLLARPRLIRRPRRNVVLSGRTVRGGECLFCIQHAWPQASVAEGTRWLGNPSIRGPAVLPVRLQPAARHVSSLLIARAASTW